MTGEFTSIQPPLISVLWAVIFKKTHGTWLILILQNIFWFSSIYLLLQKSKKLTFKITISSLFCLFWPPILNLQGVIVKDVSFACLCIFCFCLLDSNNYRETESSSWRIEILTSAIALSVAAGTRQQGIFALIIGAVICVYRLTRRLGAGVFSIPALAISASSYAAFIFAVLTLLSFIPVWVTGKMPGVDYRTPLYLVMRYDVAGILYRAPDIDPAEFKRSIYDMDEFIGTAQKYYTGERTDYFDKKFDENPRAINFDPSRPHEFSDLFGYMRNIWLDAIRQRPIAYLSHRWDSFAWLLGLRDESKCIPVLTGRVEGVPAMRAYLGLNDKLKMRDAKIDAFLKPLVKTPIYSHWLYLLLNCGILIYSISRYQIGDEALLGLSATAVIMTMSFLPIGLACDFRYLYFPMVACPISLLMMTTRLGVSSTRGTETDPKLAKI